jgi:hypothetical protein
VAKWYGRSRLARPLGRRDDALRHETTRKARARRNAQTF